MPPEAERLSVLVQLLILLAGELVLLLLVYALCCTRFLDQRGGEAGAGAGAGGKGGKDGQAAKSYASRMKREDFEERAMAMEMVADLIRKQSFPNLGKKKSDNLLKLVRRSVATFQSKRSVDKKASKSGDNNQSLEPGDDKAKKPEAKESASLWGRWK